MLPSSLAPLSIILCCWGLRFTSNSSSCVSNAKRDREIYIEWCKMSVRQRKAREFWFIDILKKSYLEHFGSFIPANIFMFKLSNRSTTKIRDLCPKLTIKTAERQYTQDVKTANFKQVTVCWDWKCTVPLLKTWRFHKIYERKISRNSPGWLNGYLTRDPTACKSVRCWFFHSSIFLGWW